MPSFRSVGAILLALHLAANVAQAQSAQRHEAFWIGFGIGGGWSTTEGQSEEGLGGGAGYFRLGGTLNQQWLLGGEIIVWGRAEEGIRYSRGNTTFVVLFFPSTAGGLFLKGGIGASYVDVSGDLVGLGFSVSRGGFGTTFGLGWDVKLGNNIYLTPNADLLFQAIETASGDDRNTAILALTLGLTWH
ncbi:MAG: hypothetical protein AMS18_02080 [Gemmatimonas sp. SG8_17]|nr:MAG: hypothetical protein AMS18_02080 [Gemmatimonas sp. SG8_17]